MTDSPHPSDDAIELEAHEPLKYGLNLLLFALTVPSVFLAGALTVDPTIEHELLHRLGEIWRGWPFALPLLAILLAHEFGHYVAARIHRVPASLPYFIPLPALSPFGTMGAIIAMRGRIRSRAALLDIGAAGPLAGMVVALPVLAFGLHWSAVAPNPSAHYTQEGQNLLYLLMKRVFVGPIPDGMDVQLSPTADAGWVGLFITMINLVPWGQLDGGHIAFALLGERQHRIARFVRRSMIGLFGYNLLKFYLPIALHRSALDYRLAIGDSLFWLVWFAVTGIIGRVSGGPDHPPFEPSELGPARRAIAWLCLALFALLFMPTPWAGY
ncbi:MAG TPA: site-2 protease family protein [Polyangiaceae bacterium]|jgi:membrane-associated protease RseP (regulator of RpoE activity)|nr:site-2 protease family protein [Polyangiaceae bacterium]